LPDWSIEVEYTGISILKELEKKQKLVKNPEKEKIFYHYNYSANPKIRKEIQKLLRLLGYEIIAEEGCCGAGGSLDLIQPELSGKIADKLINKIKKNNVSKIVVISPDCYLHLKDKLKNSRIEIFELSEIVANGLSIK